MRVKQDMQALKDELSKLTQKIEEIIQRQESLLLDVADMRNVKPVEKPNKTLIASRQSNKVHKKSCTHARNIRARNQLVFQSQQDALLSGFEMCECLA